MPHHTHASARRSNPRTDLPDLLRGLSASPAAVQQAAEIVDEALAKTPARHLFCGGIAVAAHGYMRATRDVDFLVGDEAFITHGRLVSMQPGLPFRVGDVAIDYVTLPDIQGIVEHELDTNKSGVVSLPLLVLMKLIANRPRDRNDVTELLKIDVDRVRDVRVVLDSVYGMLSGQILARWNDRIADMNQ